MKFLNDKEERIWENIFAASYVKLMSGEDYRPPRGEAVDWAMHIADDAIKALREKDNLKSK